MHDAEHGPAGVDEADRNRAAPPADEVVAGPVVRVDEPDRRAVGAVLPARLLAQVAPVGERLAEPAADEPLGVDVRLRLVDLSARAAGAMEVRAQHVAGLTGGRQGDLERAP